MKTKLISFGLFLICLLGFGQTTIYLEDFTGQNGQGAIGPGGNNPVLDLTNVNWTLDISNVNLANANDYFSVRTVNGNELFEGRDLDTQAIWFSPVIDITNFTDVSFSLEVSESNGTGGDNLESSDTVAIEYRINGGPWNLAANNGSFSNDFDLTVVSQNGLNGETLELRITVVNNGGGERQRFDNIEVRGFEDCTVFGLPFTEDFEGESFPPNCWTSYRGLNNLGTENDWTSSTLVANSGTTSAFVEFEVVSGGNAQDWLVTPAIDLGTNQSQLRFFAGQQFTVDYDTEYTVRISESSATDISSFTILKTYNETELGNIFNEKTIDLSSYSGVVYISFVMEQNDGDNWFLDDVSIIDISGCTSPLDVTDLNANFSDGFINLDWNLSTCYDEILIVAKEGGPVTASPTGDGTAFFSNSNFGEGFEISTDEFVVYKGIESSVAVSNITFGNAYHFEVFTRKASSWSTGVPLSIDLDYCEVNGDTSFDTSITLVSLGAIENATGQGSGYDDFTLQSTSLRQGETENLMVNLNTDGNFAVYSYAWVDWNQDGDFDDEGETYDLGETINNPDGATSNSPSPITVPHDATLGNTRLRVLCQYYFGTIPENGACEGSTDGEIEDYTISVLPAITYVYDDGWLPEDPSGIATSANPIEIIRGEAIISSDTACKSVVVNPASSLIVDNGVVLDVANSLDLMSSSIAYSSLILNGTINGTINYSRHVNAASGSNSETGNNDLISTPLQGLTFGELTASNDNILSGTIGGNPTFLFGPFNPTTGVFLNFTPANNTDLLAPGIGYRTGSTNNDTYSFSGSVETGIIEVPVFAGGATNWNLIGNPYPSYINVQALLNESENSSRFDESAIGIYGYDGAASDGWTIYNLATTNPTTVIAPGQGFFINAESTGVIRFTPAMRTTGASDDFVLGRPTEALTFLKLKLSSGDQSYKTEFYFNTNSTIGLDPGYDAEVWNSTLDNFALFSTMLQGDTELPLAVQSLHSDDLTDIVIPLGVYANPQIDLSFNLEDFSLPEGTEVYLLDMEAESSTLLNNGSYNISIESAQNGTGRFYLKFSNARLNTPVSNLTELSIIYSSQSRNIQVLGQLESLSILSVYDITGKQVIQQELEISKSQKTADLTNLSPGVYVVELSNITGVLTKKIIVE